MTDGPGNENVYFVLDLWVGENDDYMTVRVTPPDGAAAFLFPIPAGDLPGLAKELLKGFAYIDSGVGDQ
jgi:hypothetical protein